MKARSLRASLFALILIMFTAAPALAGTGWELSESEGKVKVFTRAQSGSDVDAVRVQVHLPWSSDAVAAIMTDLDQHKGFQPALKKLDVLRTATLSNGRLAQVIYQIQHVPALDNRDVVLYTETWSEKSDKGNIWRSSFRAVTNEGPKPTDDMVRITSLAGRWEIRPTKTGSVLTYTCHTEVGGNIPDFMAQSGQIDAALEMFVKFEQHCRKSIK